MFGFSAAVYLVFWWVGGEIFPGDTEQERPGFTGCKQACRLGGWMTAELCSGLHHLPTHTHTHHIQYITNTCHLLQAKLSILGETKFNFAQFCSHECIWMLVAVRSSSLAGTLWNPSALPPPEESVAAFPTLNTHTQGDKSVCKHKHTSERNTGPMWISTTLHKQNEAVN